MQKVVAPETMIVHDCSKRFGTTTASAFSEMPTENCLSQTTILRLAFDAPCLGAPKAILIALIMFFFSSQNARRVVAASNSLRKSQWQGSASGVLENLRLFVPVGPMAEESCKKNLNHRGKKYRICWTEPKTGVSPGTQPHQTDLFIASKSSHSYEYNLLWPFDDCLGSDILGPGKNYQQEIKVESNTFIALTLERFSEANFSQFERPATG